GWPASLQPALRRLRDEGLVALIAHPERNPEVQDHPARLLPWVAAGALVQVTAASLDGTLGRASRRGAQALLELGLVHVLASDAHGPHIRLGGLAAAADSLGDTGLARHLTLDVPAAIVAGDEVPALSRSG
ncbi:MAG: CpsB/CapC family capsule biosynthesis tyrosine phosphatase, partial [Gaiellaceae bacterium]